MKQLLLLSLLVLLTTSCNNDPYEEGTHWDYSIICEDGFKYKCMSKHKGIIPVLNSDGTHLKCNQKKY